MFFPEDYPKGGEKLPRALAEHVIAQVEDPANLARQGNPAYRLITIILIRCGLRVSDAIGLPFDCVVRDADGAPYLRYYNRKMKREALVPIDDELQALIGDQQNRAREHWPDGTRFCSPARPRTSTDTARSATQLPGRALPLAGRLRRPRRARPARAPDPAPVETHPRNQLRRARSCIRCNIPRPA